MIEAWRNAHKLRDPGVRQAWLHGIARNVCMRWRRAQGLEHERLPRARVDWDVVCTTVADAADAPDVVERNELAALLHSGLDQLPPLWVVLAIQGISGVAAGPLNPVLATLRYERVPAAMRGRVFGMTTAGAFAAMPLGVLIAGVALDRFGLRVTFLAVGICYVVTTLTLVINPAIREMDPAPSLASAP